MPTKIRRLSLHLLKKFSENLEKTM